MDFNLIDMAMSEIHANGGRMTNQRRLILETLSHYADHPTAEEIYERVRLKNRALNLSTVYRTLRWLEQRGLVNTRVFEDERCQERFDPIIKDDGMDHYHFRCSQCNQIIEFSTQYLENIKSQYCSEYGGLVQKASLILYGTCASCTSA